jgi:hypothetical protein
MLPANSGFVEMGFDVKEAWDWKRRQGEKKAKSSDQVLRSDSSALL